MWYGLLNAQCRCTTVLALKMTQTVAFEDRKLRKDIQVRFGSIGLAIITQWLS